MDIHEYQAKAILAEYGVAIPDGGLAYSPEQAAYRAHEIGGDTWAEKAKCTRALAARRAASRCVTTSMRSGTRPTVCWVSAWSPIRPDLGGKGVFRLYVESGIAT